MDILSFHYHLKINFDAPVWGHHFTLRCIPVTDARQHILQVQQFVAPRDFLSESVDSFGNRLFYGAAGEKHTAFESDICGEAEVGLATCVPAENPLRESIFLYPTALTAADEELKRAAKEWKYGDSLEQSWFLMEKLGESLIYTPGATDVRTTAAEAFAMGQGVCQDYAHIMLSLLRQQGHKARYVVGMLMGEGKSHAWVEVEHNGNWYGFDPTNRLTVEDSHIKISHGRDYADCTVSKGRFFGFASQQQEISVIVQKK